MPKTGGNHFEGRSLRERLAVHWAQRALAFLSAAILNQIFPGSGVIAPLAGQRVAQKYSRNEEYAADRHGAELLVRAGYPKQMMIDTLTWLMQTSGSDSGGFFATHPGTEDRIAALKKVSAR